MDPKNGLVLEPVTHEGVTVDLMQKVKIGENPEKEIPALFEAIRYNLVEARRGALTEAQFQEALKKATSDLEELIKQQGETLKDYRTALRQIPEPGGKGKLDLRRLDLRYETPSGESEKSARGQAAFHSVMGLSKAHYNVLCRTVNDLGVEDKPSRSAVARFQYLHDCLALKSAYLAKKSPQIFHAMGGWLGFPEAKEYQELALQIGQGIHETRLGPALNETNAEEGKNWVPPPILSARILPLIEEEVVLLSYFEQIPMPGPEYRLPVVGSHIKSRKLNENILDTGLSTGAKIVADYFKTKKLDLVAKLHAAGAVVTPNWMQDAVGTDNVLRDLAYAIARGREDWMLNGQLTAALDGVTIADDDIRKMGDGLRYWYKQMKDAAIIADVDFSAGITVEGLTKMFGQQKSYGNRFRTSIWIANTSTLAQCLVLKGQGGGFVVTTVAEAGDRSTFRTGVLAQMFARDLVVVNDLADTMDATGIIPAVASDRSALLHVNTEAVKVGSRLGTEIAYSTDYRFFEYQEAFRAVARDDISKVYDPTTEPFTSQGVGIRKI